VSAACGGRIISAMFKCPPQRTLNRPEGLEARARWKVRLRRNHQSVAAWVAAV